MTVQLMDAPARTVARWITLQRCARESKEEEVQEGGDHQQKQCNSCPSMKLSPTELPTINNDTDNHWRTHNQKMKEEVFLILFRNDKKTQKATSTCVVEIARSEFKSLFNTGALVNVMGVQQYSRLRPKPPSRTKLFTYGSQSPLPLRDRMTVNICSNNQEILETFQVVDKEAGTC
ncbi:hypothetical protein NDU88_007133 [Pleurodeles waltl]|uniref:Uncharacterized protein n=1 Tax=Pleurodeles waltl TaxID=8319 RepID=A0AAV7PSM2_PLEWA|nr:hypothetical protein NDU88_007133 [Pleurodeles waltl]